MSKFSPGSGDIPESKAVDRRVHERRLITPRLYVVLHGSNGDGILNDVSEGGAALDIVGGKLEGEYLLVDFEMPETGQRIEATGRITWRDEAANKVGVQFMDLPEASRTLIRDWLFVRPVAEETEHSALVQDAERENLSVPTSPTQNPPEVDRLVQSLMDSFSKQKRTPKERIFALTDLSGQVFSQRSSLLKWIGLSVAAGLATLFGYLFLTHRWPERASSTVSVSKVGQQPVGSDQARSKDGGGGDNQGDGGGNGSTPPGSRLSLPAMLSTLPSAGRTPCVKLGATGDKIRVYLWTEKNTPEIITLTYAKYLNSVLDLRVVDQAPYDLVLYVNGADVGANGPAAGYLWSSRVFRPWYCGETLGLLEETKVNESLHYVQGANLDQHIQAETAYLILHTLESIRSENTK
jgi:PilZ domain